MTTQQLIEYTIQRIGQMQISDRYKMELLTLITQIQTSIEKGEKDGT